MQSLTTLRLLSLFSFLLLICPFYDSCAGKGMKDKAVEVPRQETNLKPNINHEIKEVATPISEVKEPFLNRIYYAIDDEETQNALEFAWVSFDLFDLNFQEFSEDIQKSIKKKDFSGFFFWLKNFSFLFISIFTFLNLVLCFTSKLELVFRLSQWNLVLTLFTIICIFLEGFFEEISQIKWGYYCFLIVSILIFYISKKLLKPQMP